MDSLIYSNYRKLASAIILQAVKDYKKVYKDYLEGKRDFPEDQREYLIHNEWFNEVMDLLKVGSTMEYLIRQVEKSMKKEE